MPAQGLLLQYCVEEGGCVWGESREIAGETVVNSLASTGGDDVF